MVAKSRSRLIRSYGNKTFPQSWLHNSWNLKLKLDFKWPNIVVSPKGSRILYVSVCSVKHHLEKSNRQLSRIKFETDFALCHHQSLLSYPIGLLTSSTYDSQSLMVLPFGPLLTQQLNNTEKNCCKPATIDITMT